MRGSRRNEQRSRQASEQKSYEIFDIFGRYLSKYLDLARPSGRARLALLESLYHPQALFFVLVIQLPSVAVQFAAYHIIVKIGSVRSRRLSIDFKPAPFGPFGHSAYRTDFKSVRFGGVGG